MHNWQVTDFIACFSLGVVFLSESWIHETLQGQQLSLVVFILMSLFLSDNRTSYSQASQLFSISADTVPIHLKPRIEELRTKR